jgi:hypothetical protein
VNQTAGQLAAAVPGRHVSARHDELVAAEPGDQVGGPYGRGEPLRDRDEDGVAGLV